MKAMTQDRYGSTDANKVTPVIDRTYSLNEAPMALSDANEGHGRGKAVITI
jgi:NADPH:quinone reductase-like Zn-dependent oxidoreductase